MWQHLLWLLCQKCAVVNTQPSQEIMQAKLEIYLQKNEIKTVYLNLCKVNLMWNKKIKDLNFNFEILNHLLESREYYWRYRHVWELFWVEIWQHRNWNQQAGIHKIIFIQEMFWHTCRHYQQNKWSVEWEKVFAN